jgi:hypothetical protein
MPDMETMDCNDLAVLWAFEGRSNAQGQPVVSAVPCELHVRWVGRQSSVLDKDGHKVSMDATAVLGENAPDVDLDSILWLGGLRDLPNPNNTPTAGLHVVKTFNKTTSLDGRRVRRKVGLMRYNGTLPTG